MGDRHFAGRRWRVPGMIVQKNIVILGAGGFGREVHAWLLDWIARGDGQ